MFKRSAVTVYCVVSLFAQVAAAQSAAPAAPAVPARPAPLDQAALEQKIDQLMQGHVKVNGFTGTILLASGGKPLVAKGYGFANVEWQIPNAPDTKFRIGSVTKQFTSMLIMLLREQGRLKVEDSVCSFVTPCPDAWKPVTVHHLLTHTSGIPTYTGLKSWRDTMMVPRTVEQMIDLFRNLPLEWTPGEKYAYNNSGYFLLGAIVEKVTGKKYDAALKEMILAPLGMSDTGYDWPSTILPKRANGYSGRGDAVVNAPPLDMQAPYAAGSMYSTVGDLLKWDQALYTERLLPEPAKQIMWTPFKNNYAYGWMIAQPSAETFGHRRVVHTGGINGFASIIIRLPETNVTAIVLTNNMTVPAAPVARDLLALYFGQPYTVPVPPVVAKVNPSVYDAYVGTYELAPGFNVTITREGDSLMSQATGQGKFELFPQSDTQFFARVTELGVTFVKGPDGAVTHFVLSQGGRTSQAKKVK